MAAIPSGPPNSRYPSRPRWSPEEAIDDLKRRNKSLKHRLQGASDEKDQLKEELDYYRSKYEQLYTHYDKLNKDYREVKAELERHRHQGGGGGRAEGDLASRYEKAAQHLRRATREKEELEKSLQGYVDSSEHAQEECDELRYRLSEVRRDRDRLNERVAALGPALEQAKEKIAQLTEEKAKLQQCAQEGNQAMASHAQSTPPSSALTNGLPHPSQFESERQGYLAQIQRLQDQCHMLEATLAADRQKARGRGAGGMGRKEGEKGASSPDFNALFGRTESATKPSQHLASMVSFKLSSSASNLEAPASGSGPAAVAELRRQLAEANQRCQEIGRENTELRAQLVTSSSTTPPTPRGAGGLEEVRQELQVAEEKLEAKARESNELLNQMRVVTKEKAVAMREHSILYTELQKLRTQVMELRTEKDLAFSERDINSQQADQLRMEQVSAKRKLEAIKQQRSADARELSNMKSERDNSNEELESTRKTLEEVAATRDKVEQTLHQVRSALSRSCLRHGVRWDASSSPNSLVDQTTSLVEALAAAESVRNALLEKLFTDDPSVDIEAIGVAQAVGKLDMLLNKIHDLRAELRQKGSDHFAGAVGGEWAGQEAEGHRREVVSLNQWLNKARQDRDTLREEVKHLDSENQALRSKHDKIVEEHAKTLERVDELWKQKWKINWDGAWEEKYLSFQLDQDGRAGFAIMGGRDQSQLPNPNAVIITQVIPGSRAERWLRVGDVVESVNGRSLSNVEHREAVKAVKDFSSGCLNMVIKRRRATNAATGIGCVLQAVGKSPRPVSMVTEPQVEMHEFSIQTGREGLGFMWSWDSVYRISELSSVNFCDQFLQLGDKILKVNNTAVSQVKPSAMKKLLKQTNKQGVLKLQVERASQTATSPAFSYPSLGYLRSASTSPGDMMALSPSSAAVTQDENHTCRTMPESTYMNGSEGMSGEGSATEDFPSSYSEGFPRPTFGHYHGYERRNRHASNGSTSSGDAPSKLVSIPTQRRQGEGHGNHGCTEGDFNECRIEFPRFVEPEVSQGESQPYSSSEYLQETGEYASSSQSIPLTFNEFSTVMHNDLTVATLPPTQGPDTYFEREGNDRRTMRRRDSSASNMDSEMTGYSQTATQDSMATGSSLPYLSRFGRQGRGSKPRLARQLRNFGPWNGDNESMLSLNSHEHAVDHSSGELRTRAYSDADLKGGKPSGGVQQSRSLDSMYEQCHDNGSQGEDDPMTGAVYIRAKFSYLPRRAKELRVDALDVFHILDDSPMMKGSFRVSRLSNDGTDAEQGIIPNSFRAQRYICEQGQDTVSDPYEEVEPYYDVRPVLVFGALARHVTTRLIEEFPSQFFSVSLDAVDSQVTESQLIETQLGPDIASGHVLFYQVDKAGQLSVLHRETLVRQLKKRRHCILPSSAPLMDTLADLAPPISVLIKARHPESISMFHPDQISSLEAQKVFDEVTRFATQHEPQCTISIFLITLEVLVNQVKDLIQEEQHKQSWVPVTRVGPTEGGGD